MKLVHQISVAPASPETGVRYGARIKSLAIEGKNVTCNWVIYTRRSYNGRKPSKAEKALA